MNPETLKILTDKDVIALNQDPLGIQALKYSAQDGMEVWFKPLAEDAWAMCVLNRNTEPQKFTFDWKSEKVTDEISNRETSSIPPPTGCAICGKSRIWGRRERP